MSWQFTALAVPTIVAMLVAVTLCVYTLRQRQVNDDTPLLRAFLAVNVGLVVWTLFSTLKLLHTDPTVKLLLYRLLYFGVSPLGAFALLFVLIYTGRETEIRPRVVAALLAVPVAYLVVLFVNPFELAIESTRVVERAGLVILRVDTGLAHLVLELGYNALLLSIAVGLMLSEAVRLGQSYVPQALLVAGGVAAPFAAVVLSVAQIPPFTSDTVNFVPASAGLSSLALGLAVARYQFLDLSPIAYTTAIDLSPDSVLVLDERRKIVHANERGNALLQRLDVSLGSEVTAVHPSLDLETEPREVIHPDNHEHLALSPRSQLLEQRGRAIGWVVVLRDVTTLEAQRQTMRDQNEKLTLLNEVLRHDIQNDMMVVRGNAALLLESLDDSAVTTRLDTIVRNSEHASELTESVRTLMAMMVEDGETTKPVDLRSVLATETDALDGNAVVDTPDTSSLDGVRVVADDLLGEVFRNLLTNAVRHNRNGEPRITVSVERHADNVVVRVADNGPGIPDDRKDEVFGRGEKGLESPGTGLGLYLVDTVVSEYGGDVWVEDSDPTGATFAVRLRRVE